MVSSSQDSGSPAVGLVFHFRFGAWSSFRRLLRHLLSAVQPSAGAEGCRELQRARRRRSHSSSTQGSALIRINASSQPCKRNTQHSAEMRSNAVAAAGGARRAVDCEQRHSHPQTNHCSASEQRMLVFNVALMSCRNGTSWWEKEEPSQRHEASPRTMSASTCQTSDWPTWSRWGDAHRKSLPGVCWVSAGGPTANSQTLSH